MTNWLSGRVTFLYKRMGNWLSCQHWALSPVFSLKYSFWAPVSAFIQLVTVPEAQTMLYLLTVEFKYM